VRGLAALLLVEVFLLLKLLEKLSLLTGIFA